MKSSLFIGLLRILAAVLFIQTLYFKFTGAPESVYIFSKLGIEPYGRIGTGIFELFTAIIILIPRTVLIGTLLGFVLIRGAILSHPFVLGIEVQNNGGSLFILALIIFLSCSIIIYYPKSQFLNLLKLKI